MSNLSNVFSLRSGVPVPSIRDFYPGQPVECADPDILADTGRPVMTFGTVHAIANDNIYVQLAGEPEAARPFKPHQLTPAPRG